MKVSFFNQTNSINMLPLVRCVLACSVVFGVYKVWDFDKFGRAHELGFHNLDRQLISGELKYSLHSIKILDRVSRDIASPDGYVYALLEYTQSNLGNKPLSVNLKYPKLGIVAGKTIWPDISATDGLRQYSISEYPSDAIPFNSEQPLIPGQSCEVYAVYKVPLADDLRGCRLDFE